MTRPTRTVLTVVAFVALLCMGLASQDSTPAKGTGHEWLSWSPEERRILVGAYLQGYLMGKTDACIGASQLFDVGEPVYDPKDTVDARCFRHAKAYSREPAEYIAVLTEFYSHHPEFRNIPTFYLLMSLTDDRYRTADEIYQGALKGEIRTKF